MIEIGGAMKGEGYGSMPRSGLWFTHFRECDDEGESEQDKRAWAEGGLLGVSGEAAEEKGRECAARTLPPCGPAVPACVLAQAWPSGYSLSPLHQPQPHSPSF